MKILLSAYACEPLKGSEPTAGWKWAYELSKRGHDVHIITRSNNKSAINQYLKQEKSSLKINFFYYDLPSFFLKIKKKFKCVNLYYFLWQVCILKICKKHDENFKFDIIHHITFGGLRHFSILGELEANTIIGPLGGAETSPFWLRKHIGFKGAIHDTLRDIVNSALLIDPFFLRSLKKCTKLIFTTKAGLRYCQNIDKSKVYVCPIIGLSEEEYPSKRVSAEKQKNILFAGRHLPWKGMKIGIEAFNISLKKDPYLKLTILGSGQETKYWRKIVNKYQMNSNVNWIPWLSKSDYEKIFQEHGIFIFPSLHDSGGFVVLDALKNGLPVICFDLGGPADTVNNLSGKVIKTVNKDYKLLLNNFSNAINHLASDLKSWESLSIGAQKRARDFSMANVVNRIYN